MSKGRLFSLAMDVVEFILRWLVAWFVTFGIVGSVLATATVQINDPPGRNLAVAGVLLSVCGMLLVGAIYDFWLRAKGRTSLFAVIASLLYEADQRAAPFFSKVAGAVSNLTGIVACVLVFGLLSYLLFLGVSALPVSVAIIVGALIIAGALRNR